MNKYAFILGRNPELSIAELGALFDMSLRASKAQRSNLAFVDGELPQKPQDFLNRLGGCVEILEIFKESIAPSELETTLVNFLKNKTGKIVFALNLVPDSKKSRLLKFLLPRVKKYLQQAGRSAGFLNKNFQNVSPVAAVKQKLVERGTNISIVELGGGKISLGYSAAMQDFESYSKRDYGKPFRDPQVGMLPPKLAQIMVNLCLCERCAKRIAISGITSALRPINDIVIFDPFCGTGTILMEALLMGYSVIGSDVDARLVEGARKNIDWLRQIFSSRVPGNTTRERERARFFQKDATKLTASDVIASRRFSAYSNNAAKPQPYAEGWPKQSEQGGSHALAVVTEPYLGPPLSSFPAENFLKKLRVELEKLYVDFFTNLSKWLPKGTPIVFIFPYWKKGYARLRLAPPLIAKIESLGYSKTTFVPLQTDSLFYDRPDSVVGREIIRFVKNSAA